MGDVAPDRRSKTRHSRMVRARARRPGITKQMPTSCISIWLAILSAYSESDSTFRCDSAEWRTHNGQVKCGSIGGNAALELADADGWSHAYQEVPVVADATYNVSAELYALAEGVCDCTAKVVWCSPSVVVCPGTYNARFYNEGGCYVGLASKGNGTWEMLSASFTPTVTTVTVYIAQVLTTTLLQSSRISGCCSSYSHPIDR